MNVSGLRFLSTLTLALCFWLGLVQSAIWNGAATPAWITALPGAHGLASHIFTRVGAPLSMEPYYFFGRIVPAVYAGLLITLFRLPHLRPALQRPRAYRLMLIALLVALAGDLTAYWGGGWYGTGVRFWGFWVTEVPSLLAAMAAALTAGITIRREDRTAGLVLALLPLMSILATLAFAYMPHGPLLGFCLAGFLLLWLPSGSRPAA